MRKGSTANNGGKHSFATETEQLMNDLRMCHFVRQVGAGSFRRINRIKKPAYRLKYYNAFDGTYKLSVRMRDFEQDTFVRVDPARRLFFDRFIYLYFSQI